MLVKYLKYLNGILELTLKFETYNNIIDAYKSDAEEIRKIIVSDLDQGRQLVQILPAANEASLKGLGAIQNKTIELIDLCREAHAKASTIAQEDIPLLNSYY